MLHAQAPAIFPSAFRAGYVITNAWPGVEYPALTGRSVPSVQEVMTPANLQRLAEELMGLKWVVACGQQAQAAVRALAETGLLSAQVAVARHLSQRSINMIPGASDTPGRMAIWCAGVLEQLSLPQS
jgi:hypothetical protein